jgi:hypothetical protein
MSLVLTDSQTRGLLDVIVGATPLKRDTLGHLYLAQAGADLPRYLAEYFGRETQAAVRVDLLRFAGPLAASDDRVLGLATLALSDRSSKVRRMALWLFARSGDHAALPVLRSWSPPSENDAANRERALMAIELQDLQEWVRGTPYYGVIPWEFTREEVGSEAFNASIDTYIKGYSAALVPALERALGDIYLAR